MLLRIPLFALALAAFATALPGFAQSTDVAPAAATVPNLIRYSGTAPRSPHPDLEIASLEFNSLSARSRWLILAVTLTDAPVFFVPYDDLSTGIPDGWNGSVLYALFEGLAGIKDKGAAFSKTALTPRWLSAKVPSA
jgi:hypothetical protein